MQVLFWVRKEDFNLSYLMPFVVVRANPLRGLCSLELAYRLRAIFRQPGSAPPQNVQSIAPRGSPVTEEIASTFFAICPLTDCPSLEPRSA